MKDSLVHWKGAACVTGAHVEVYKQILMTLFRSLFFCQVVMDSVSIVDDVGDWPPEVVQEESNQWVLTQNNSIQVTIKRNRVQKITLGGGHWKEEDGVIDNHYQNFIS